MPRRESIPALREAARTEAAALVKLAAGNRSYTDTIEACIARAATKLGWSYGRTMRIWRKRARLIESFELDALRALSRHNVRRKTARKKPDS